VIDEGKITELRDMRDPKTRAPRARRRPKLVRLPDDEKHTPQKAPSNPCATRSRPYGKDLEGGAAELRVARLAVLDGPNARANPARGALALAWRPRLVRPRTSSFFRALPASRAGELCRW